MATEHDGLRDTGCLIKTEKPCYGNGDGKDYTMRSKSTERMAESLPNVPEVSVVKVTGPRSVTETEVIQFFFKKYIKSYNIYFKYIYIKILDKGGYEVNCVSLKFI